jgi:hypothetical protein
VNDHDGSYRRYVLFGRTQGMGDERCHARQRDRRSDRHPVGYGCGGAGRPGVPRRVDIGGNVIDCVLMDQAESGAAVAYRMARALAAKAGPADRVVAGLAELAGMAGLGQRELLARTTRFCPGTGKGQLEHKVIRIQVIGAAAPWQDEQALWRKFLEISGELLDLPGHRRPEGYRKRLGSGSRARDALTEGVVSLLTEIVWSDVLSQVSGPALRAAVGDGHAVELPSSCRRGRARCRTWPVTGMRRWRR